MAEELDAEEERLYWAKPLLRRVLAGRWLLTRLIGAGGAGAVFEGEHQAVGRAAAIKVLRPDLRTVAPIVRRFQREAKAAAAVGHQGVVDVVDFDVDPHAGPFLVMELLRGRTLFEALRRGGAIELRRALRLGEEVLDTLQAVHASGIVHRDLKPENIFLTQDERVKILDFGISRFETLTGGTVLTAPGALVGTPRYMAPEQARGQPDIDARVDVYAAGGILYSCLAGQPPYAEVPGRQILGAVLTGPPRPLAEIAPSVPAGIAHVVTQAMAHDRARRYPSISALRSALAVAAG